MWPPEGGEDDALLQRLLGLHLARDVGEAAALARLYHLAHHDLRENIIMSVSNIISFHLTFMNLEESWPAFLLYTEEGMELVLGRGGTTVSELDRHRLWDRRAGCGV